MADKFIKLEQLSYFHDKLKTELALKTELRPSVFFANVEVMSSSSVNLSDINTNGVEVKVGDVIVDTKHNKYFVATVTPASGTEGHDGYVAASVTVGQAVGVNDIANKKDVEAALDKKVDKEGYIAYTQEEKDKLAGVAANANNYVLPAATADALGGVKVGTGVTVGEDGTVSVSADRIPYGDSTIKAILDDLTYVPADITGFSNNVGTVENGQTITDVKFDWTIKGNPTKVTFTSYKNGADGDATNEDEVVGNKGSRILTKQTITTNHKWTLSVDDARKHHSSRDTWLVFKNKKYWGVGKPENADTVDSAFILALGNSQFADNAKGDFSVNATDGNFIFFAVPQAFGNSPAFYVGGFEGGFSLYKTFDFTNASGATVSYNVFKSTNADLGDTTVTVK